MIRLSKYTWRLRPSEKRRSRAQRRGQRNRWGYPVLRVKRFP